jgi:hypothetical protein
MSGLSFYNRVETNFDAFVFQSWEESIYVIGASVGYLGVEEAGVYEGLGDSLLSSEGLLALEASNVGKSRLDGMRDSLVCPNGRVVHIPCLRSFLCISGSRTNRRQSYFERRASAAAY